MVVGDPRGGRGARGGGEGPEGNASDPGAAERNWGVATAASQGARLRGEGPEASGPAGGRPGARPPPRPRLAALRELTNCKALRTRRYHLSLPREKQAARPLRAPLPGPGSSSVVGLYTAPFSIAQGPGTRPQLSWRCGLHRLRKSASGAVTSWAPAPASCSSPAPTRLRPLRPEPLPSATSFAKVWGTPVVRSESAERGV